MVVKDDFVCYVMNQRLVQMDSGRLVLPVSGRDPRVSSASHQEGVTPKNGFCFLSDDAGATWRRSRGQVLDTTPRGVQEPCVAQVGRNMLLMLYRSGHGFHMACFSKDGGETWSPPEPTTLQAACSPLTLTTLPDKRLLVVYNHAPSKSSAYFPRRPLCYAISADGGKSWSAPTQIDDEPGRQLIYPSVTPLRDGILIVYLVDKEGWGGDIRIAQLRGCVVAYD